ncbi:3-hydroxybutyryl-CoA dehydrogenase [Vibrio crassostreae]|uniref:3-hydroxybutyryl-CoA dehydrogenase n=1 Tax=Vibrio crassostreae TaxID=246167 RepID=A0A822MZH2_9VIBR|nr:3-hydroxyacyl-CoA dehydrogenase NAD-binding domain-containing protein [Vibrio crassostreae]MDH5950701.1 3-hydroxyacyl-CoA dehydrogenase NAD-binding domain-containing protein [Vibrio crassostreae]TCN07119.1 3-hydroxybutyryl-CoA dehydrogenase [Vibrio crassostreae]TCU07497.1 3-hydroxybutyryl-CoA dehydrogenase [Vibrio crassostreae]CAK2204393.1 3-hydroxybutyryl-CoA dehydrogenase [Vibrio crassostreae]CAK2215350.1 3-hydroxybutyryl-CoA dehydrogenase [Vibrio crassostreae]
MKISVLGSGQMGAGIASLMIQSSAIDSVTWWARSAPALDKAFLRVKKEVRRFAKQTGQNHEELLQKLTPSTDLSQIEGSSFCVEAVSEDMEVKTDLLAKASEYLDENTIIGTNTSSLSITALSISTRFPGNVVGMHFFNPTSVMQLVEVVKGLNTLDGTVEQAMELASNLDKDPVLVNESPGFIVNRMLIPMINEAISVYAEGVASIEDIDKAMKLGANHPLGPLSLADLIGTDVCLSIMETLHYETGDPKYRAHPLLRQYVRAGYLGRKSGRGFHVYRR